MNLNKYFLLKNIDGIINKYNLLSPENPFNKDEIHDDLKGKKIDYYVQVFCYLQRCYYILLESYLHDEDDSNFLERTV